MNDYYFYMVTMSYLLGCLVTLLILIQIEKKKGGSVSDFFKYGNMDSEIFIPLWPVFIITMPFIGLVALLSLIPWTKEWGGK